MAMQKRGKKGPVSELSLESNSIDDLAVEVYFGEGGDACCHGTACMGAALW